MRKRSLEGNQVERRFLWPTAPAPGSRTMKVEKEPTVGNVDNQQQKRALVITAVLLGAAAGVFIGILAMAVGLLVVNALSLVMNTAVLRLPGISMTAVTFVFFFAIGSLVSASYIWRKGRANSQ
jgi:hypothetical protein